MAERATGFSTPHLFIDAVAQMAGLFRTEIRLVRTELSEKIAKAVNAIALLSAAIILLLAALISAACALLFSSGKLFAQSPSTDRHDYVPAPTNYAPPAYAGNKPAPERDDASESRWAVLGERPVVTAIVGIVIGAALAAML